MIFTLQYKDIEEMRRLPGLPCTRCQVRRNDLRRLPVVGNRLVRQAVAFATNAIVSDVYYGHAVPRHDLSFGVGRFVGTACP